MYCYVNSSDANPQVMDSLLLLTMPYLVPLIPRLHWNTEPCQHGSAWFSLVCNDCVNANRTMPNHTELNQAGTTSLCRASMVWLYDVIIYYYVCVKSLLEKLAGEACAQSWSLLWSLSQQSPHSIMPGDKAGSCWSCNCRFFCRLLFSKLLSAKKLESESTSWWSDYCSRKLSRDWFQASLPLSNEYHNRFWHGYVFIV